MTYTVFGGTLSLTQSLTVDVARIQLLTAVVVHRPQCLSLDEITSSVVCLHRLLVNCKLPDVALWLLRCLLALTEFHVDIVKHSRRHSASDILQSDSGLSKDQWTSVYNDCLR